jgi:tRNA threonylcarbamoyladenosine biosynthesis protein TsaB
MTTGLKVLAIDTSTEACSVALLWSSGEMRLRFERLERGHADRVLPMVDELLREAGCRLHELDGLAFGRGPGGFTGLRIAAGVTQGLAFGAGLKVAPVSSLAAVAYLASTSVTSPASAGEVGYRPGEGPEPSPADAGEGAGAGEGVLVCNDARMNEVYWGGYRFDASAPCHPVLLAPETVSAHDRVEHPPGTKLFAGNGIPAYPALHARLESAGLRYVPDMYPRADAIARLGEFMLQRGDSVAAAGAIPVYVRDDVARPARPTVT